MTVRAIYNWPYRAAPVNIAWVQPGSFGGSGFPAELMDRANVAESGSTWTIGPNPFGKRISEFVIDGDGALLSGPTPLVEYTGVGKASVAALAAGPDGLYFSDLYEDLDFASPIARGANVLRVRFVGATCDDEPISATLAAPLCEGERVPGKVERALKQAKERIALADAAEDPRRAELLGRAVEKLELARERIRQTRRVSAQCAASVEAMLDALKRQVECLQH